MPQSMEHPTEDQDEAVREASEALNSSQVDDGDREESRNDESSSSSESSTPGEEDHSDTSTSEEVDSFVDSNQDSPSNRMSRSGSCEKQSEMRMTPDIQSGGNMRTVQRNYSDITSDGEDEKMNTTAGHNISASNEEMESETEIPATPMSPDINEQGNPLLRQNHNSGRSSTTARSSESESGSSSNLDSISEEDVDSENEETDNKQSGQQDRTVALAQSEDDKSVNIAMVANADAEINNDNDDNQNNSDENHEYDDDEDEQKHLNKENNEEEEYGSEEEFDNDDTEEDDNSSNVNHEQQQQDSNQDNIETIDLDSESSFSNTQYFVIEKGLVYNIRRQDGTVHHGRILEERATDKSDKPYEFYVHYVGLNRRLDEWVKRHRISKYSKVYEHSDFDLVNASQGPIDSIDPFSDRKVTRSFAEIDQNSAQLEKEHESITKVKFINKVVIGHFEIDAWYFSPFPGEYRKVSTIFICEFCLKYMKLDSYSYHLGKCTKNCPPGYNVYNNENLTIYKVNGEISRNQLYCQLLCLMAKLFLDHKTLYYDVAPFEFYVLCEVDEKGSHIVGYFSKEKISKENNVACILILPPYQRKGYGKLLIDFSYLLSRREGKIGGPEKPLSDLGRLSYRGYWAYTLLELMSQCQSTSMTIDELSKQSGITKGDVYYTLKSMKLIKYWKGKNVICVTRDTIAKLLLVPQFRRPKLTIDPAKVKLERIGGPSTSKQKF